jgi:chromosomal replication initiation ATPase DnaA
LTDGPQLPLALPHAPSYGREDFVPGPSNEAALKLIESWPDWPSPVVLLVGPPGAGKTHLVHIWTSLSAGEIIKASSLAAVDVRTMPSGAALAVEDIPAEAVPEEHLFHLMNSAREAGATLLLTSRTPAELWRVQLPDLRSRLRLAAPASLGAPDDELLRKVLVKLFADRQLLVEKAVVDYLISRMERSLSAAVSLVERLDREALAAGRRITRPMAAAVVSGMPGTQEEFADRQ